MRVKWNTDKFHWKSFGFSYIMTRTFNVVKSDLIVSIGLSVPPSGTCIRVLTSSSGVFTNDYKWRT